MPGKRLAGSPSACGVPGCYCWALPTSSCATLHTKLRLIPPHSRPSPAAPPAPCQSSSFPTAGGSRAPVMGDSAVCQEKWGHAADAQASGRPWDHMCREPPSCAQEAQEELCLVPGHGGCLLPRARRQTRDVCCMGMGDYQVPDIQCHATSVFRWDFQDEMLPTGTHLPPATPPRQPPPPSHHIFFSQGSCSARC